MKSVHAQLRNAELQVGAFSNKGWLALNAARLGIRFTMAL
jgi:hypothetical protein